MSPPFWWGFEVKYKVKPDVTDEKKINLMRI